MKKSVGLLLIGGILIMAIVVGLVLFLNPQSNSNEVPSVRGEKLGDIGGDRPINSADTSSGGVSSSSTDSGGNPMGDPVDNSDGQGCYDRQISYSTGNLAYESFCEEYSGEACISKRLNCSLYLKNLDKEVGGNFIIEFRAIKSEDREVVLSSNQISLNISSKVEALFQTSLQILGDEAAQNISCGYLSIEVPKERICA